MEIIINKKNSYGEGMSAQIHELDEILATEHDFFWNYAELRKEAPNVWAYELHNDELELVHTVELWIDEDERLHAIIEKNKEC